MVTDANRVTIHMGLGVWLEVDGVTTQERHSGPSGKELQAEFERLTGISIGKFEEYHDRIHGPPDSCPHCGTKKLGCGSGWVGETVIFCPDCKVDLWEDGAAAMRLAE